MATVFVPTPMFSPRSLHKTRICGEVCRVSASWRITLDSKYSQRKKLDDLSLQILTPTVPQLETSKPSNLRFDRLQPSDEEFGRSKIEFGQFMAREVILDEEFWTAAWLRAESHWEDRPRERYVDNFKRKYADEEFNALKRRCRGHHVQSCACIVMVKKEENNVKRPVLKSVVGTLDLSTRYLLNGETFPGELVKAPLFCSIDRSGPSRYGYVSNLCVAKSARRQGVASNMLHFAVKTARDDGVEEVFVHVCRNNEPAQVLYQKIGFEIVDIASSQLIEENTYLLSIKTSEHKLKNCL